MSRFDCVILGSGVLGLTIALELTKRGLRVAVVAKDLAEDATSTGFASPWAVSCLIACLEMITKLGCVLQGCK